MHRFHLKKGEWKFYLYLIPIAVIMGLPIVYIFCHAFKPMEELFAYPPRFLVKHPTLVNFRNLIQVSNGSAIPWTRYLFNSLVATAGVVVGSVIFSTSAGFALAKLKFKGKKLFMNINTAALMFVSGAVAIPSFLIVNQLHMLNTFWAHILPSIAMPVGLFLVTQFIGQVPDELIEASVVDGASHFTIYRKIILPLIRPAVVTVIILSFQSVWNNVGTSNLYFDEENLKTFAFYMGTLANNTNAVAGQGMAAASALIMFIPNLLIFILMQSNVMNTMAHSGLK
ncbi:MAG: transporter permease [Herbinix sp.]|jgi:ABC-type glycerol-3-phosphate transport system permease component|nr:transporter permease [Herbinix sp.]